MPKPDGRTTTPRKATTPPPPPSAARVTTATGGTPAVTRQAPPPPPGGKPTPPATNVLDRIAPIGFQERGIKVNVYGQSGSGKSTFGSTFPDPILWIIASGSDNPGELKSIDTPENQERIRQVVLLHSGELRVLADHARSNQEGEGAYKTLVLDHVSGLQDLILKEILGFDKIPEQKGWGMATHQQYGQCAAQCKEYLRALLNLTCNVVILGQERVFGREEGAGSDVISPTVGTALMPSIAGWLFPAVDYIVQTYKRPREEERQVTMAGQTVTQRVIIRGKVDYCLRTGPDATYTTKFRIPRGYELPEMILDPNYDKLMAVIRGESVQ